MNSIGLGDEVSWKTLCGCETERGSVVAIDGDLLKVEYGPWCDSFWAPRASVLLVRSRPR
jgi:hypothetical protein